MTPSRPAHEQDGAVVVEFAIVFVLFMTLLWGLISYGVIFAVQQSLSHASAEATRAGVDVIADADAESRADAVVADQLQWLDAAGITSQSDVVACDTTIYPAGTNCLVVEASYDWANHAIVPAILNIATPDTLTARAVIVRD